MTMEVNTETKAQAIEKLKAARNWLAEGNWTVGSWAEGNKTCAIGSLGREYDIDIYHLGTSGAVHRLLQVDGIATRALHDCIPDSFFGPNRKQSQDDPTYPWDIVNYNDHRKDDASHVLQLFDDAIALLEKETE